MQRAALRLRALASITLCLCPNLSLGMCLMFESSFHPRNVILIQKRHPWESKLKPKKGLFFYSEKQNSEKSGDSKYTFLHHGDVLAHTKSDGMHGLDGLHESS